MSKNSKKVILISLVGIVVFGMAAHWLGSHQKKAKEELVAFLQFAPVQPSGRMLRLVVHPLVRLSSHDDL